MALSLRLPKRGSGYYRKCCQRLLKLVVELRGDELRLFSHRPDNLSGLDSESCLFAVAIGIGIAIDSIHPALTPPHVSGRSRLLRMSVLRK